MSTVNLKEIATLPLADPQCFTPSKIDMVIGSDITPQILVQGLQANVSGSLLAQNTIFGWILSGPIKETVNTFSTQVLESPDDTLSTILQQFWQQEELPMTQALSEDGKFCEELYRKTTHRQEDGRYVMKLPFKREFPSTLALGHSRIAAQQQYLSVERSLERSPELREKYSEVLVEYITLNHMEATSSREVIDKGKYLSFMRY